MNFTLHATLRLENRLTGIVSRDEVEKAIAGKSFRVGQTYVQVKRLPRVVTISDADGVAVGDVVYAVIDRNCKQDHGQVATVLIRKSTQPTRAYRSPQDITQHVRH